MKFSAGVLPFVLVSLLMGIGVMVFRKQLAQASNDFYESLGLRFMVFDVGKSSRLAFVTGPLLLIASVAWLISGFSST